MLNSPIMKELWKETSFFFRKKELSRPIGYLLLLNDLNIKLILFFWILIFKSFTVKWWQGRRGGCPPGHSGITTQSSQVSIFLSLHSSQLVSQYIHGLHWQSLQIVIFQRRKHKTWNMHLVGLRSQGCFLSPNIFVFLQERLPAGHGASVEDKMCSFDLWRVLQGKHLKWCKLYTCVECVLFKVMRW